MLFPVACLFKIGSVGDQLIYRARTIPASGIGDTSQYRAVLYSPNTFPGIGPDARSCDKVYMQTVTKLLI